MTSRVQFMHKWHGTTAACALTVLILLVELPLRVIEATIMRSPREGLLVLRGAGLFWRNLPRLLETILAR
jgi:hypothetical protein